jgi:hypothetical protein
MDIKDKLISAFDKYTEFDEIVKKKNEEIKDRNANVEAMVSSLEDEGGMENLKNKYKDSLLYNAQLRMSFENLMYLISLCFELGVEIPEDIKKFYDTSLNFKSKPIFAVEKQELVTIDQEVLDNCRKELDNHPAIAMMKGISSPN